MILAYFYKEKIERSAQDELEKNITIRKRSINL